MTRLRQAISAAERNKVEKEFAKFTFFHSFEIFEGVFTPGSMKTDARTILERHKIDEDLRFDGLAINDKNSSVIEHPVWKWRRDGNGNTKPKAKA